MRWVSFDIETANPAPEDREGGDWNLGVTCAATWSCQLTTSKPIILPRTWHPKVMEPHVSERGALLPLPERMNIYDLSHLLWYLIESRDRGYTIVGWNSLGFDFRVIAETFRAHPEGAKAWATVRDLALAHTDLAFHMLCEKGFMVKMDSAAQAMGLEGKPEGISGLWAVEAWKEDREMQGRVLQYVKSDARATGQLYGAIHEQKRLQWYAKSGRLNTWDVPGGALSVAEALELPEPKPRGNWTPWDRAKFYEWTGAAPPPAEERPIGPPPDRDTYQPILL